jgi:hypothetical protein
VNKLKQIETNCQKMKKLGELWLGQYLNKADACVGMVSDFLLLLLFASKVVSFSSTETQKLAVSLFHENPKQASLFWIVSKLILVPVSVSPTYIRRVFRTPYRMGMGSWILCYYCCFASKVIGFGSTETPKVAVLLFHETIQLPSLFWIMLKLVSVLVSVLSIWTKFQKTPYRQEGTKFV